MNAGSRLPKGTDAERQASPDAYQGAALRKTYVLQKSMPYRFLSGYGNARKGSLAVIPYRPPP
jgi:hypothetical protein